MFDLQSLVLPRHAQHIVLIHFPIALFLVGVAFDLAAQWRKQEVLAIVARYNLSVAAFSTLPAIATGLLAWQFQLEGQRLKGELLLHLLFGILASILIWLVWWLHFRAGQKPGRTLPAYRLPLEFFTAVVVAVTGHLGGIISGLIPR